jgi:hypothetical protein
LCALEECKATTKATTTAAAVIQHCCAVQAEGSVLAFYNPRLGSKGPGGGSSSSGGLAVSQGAQVELLATSAGWGFCKGTTKVGCRVHSYWIYAY